MKPTILVVDDDQSIVKIMRGYLEQANYEVIVAYDGNTAMHALKRDEPDLIVLDLMLPDKDGWEITKAIRSDSKLQGLPIIMLTARVDDTDKIVGLELGADDYITKPFNPREVVARIRALLRRSNQLNASQSDVITIGSLSISETQHTFKIDDQEIDLTPTEFSIMHIFMENPGFTFTREELLEKSVGYAYEGMGRTLDTHIRNLRRKIEPNPSEPTYIQTVHGIGYRFSSL